MALDDIGIDLNDGFLSEYFVGPELREVVETITNDGVMLTQSEIAKRTGRLAASTHGHTGVGPVLKGDPRWIGEITVGGQGSLGTVGADPHSGQWDYAASNIYGAGNHPGSTGRHHNAPSDVLDSVREQLGSL